MVKMDNTCIFNSCNKIGMKVRIVPHKLLLDTLCTHNTNHQGNVETRMNMGETFKLFFFILT